MNKRWQCTVCGYIHTGEAPPDKCPVCGADKSKFILLEESPVAQPVDTHQDREDTAPPEQTAGDSGVKNSINKKEELLRTLTRLHAHPITVHIPNGVLPLTVVFTIIAVLFNSEGFATAAKYNMIFVCFLMPAVILTGLNDWRNRFEQRISRVFTVKMVCAGIVTLLSAIIAIWWIFQPAVFMSGAAGSGLFIALNIFDLIAAAVAGWFGGKLVFPKN